MTPQALVLCTLFGAIVLALALRRMDRSERPLIALAFVLHVFASVALVVYHLHVSEGGDMLMYLAFGKRIAFVIDANPLRWGLETLKLALQLDNDLPVEVILPGTSTGTMSAFAGLLMFLVGDTAYGVCLLVSYLSFWGSVALYRAVRSMLALSERRAVLIGLLLMPSVLFWSSGLVKEAFVIGFLGITCNAASELLAHRRVLAVASLIVGVEGIAVTKPYVLVALVVALGGWFYAKSKRQIGSVYKLIATAGVILGMVVLARWFPEFSVENIGGSVAQSQRNYALAATGGSNIEFGDDDAPPTILGQLRWAPFGLMNSLARPFLFEARNATMLLAAFEVTFLVILLAFVVKSYGPKRIVAEIRSTPMLLFATVLVLSFGTSVGTATKNLGTLSRYRVPMMPVYAAGVLLLRARMKRTAGVRKPSAAPKVRGLARARGRTESVPTARRRAG